MDRIDEKYIEQFVGQYNYDIRQTHNARFTDQKCIPDVVCAVAECILEFAGNDLGKTFTKNDIWHFEYSNALVTESFSKPDAEDKQTEAEYDKFFAQPLKLLAAAHVLDENYESGKNIYNIAKPEILCYISQREKNALTFLDIYLTKVMKDSGCIGYFENFFRLQNKESFYGLRDHLMFLFNTYTPIKNHLEPQRIFNKIINILAFRRKKRGTIKGQLSKFPITIDEIRYNRLNWRDIDKPKGMPRQAYESQVQGIIDANTGYYERSVNKAKQFVRNLEVYSEVHHYPAYKATDAHHIFMKSDYPELADMPENIIALTGTEHYTYAHPDRNTQRTDPNYQMICLISKLDSIERNFQSGLNDYSLADFVSVLNTGLQTDAFDERMGFEGIKANLLLHLRPA